MLPINPDVISVQPLPEYRILVEFSNGERKVFDVTPYLSKGIFVKIRDPGVFNAVRVVYGSVEWPGEIDLSYNTLYIDGTPVNGLTSGTLT